jgi:CMP/dCMP kinase
MTKRDKPIIAIDGPSGAGKSTISQRVAIALDFVFLDTGAMYRCVGLRAMRKGIDPQDETAMRKVLKGLTIDFVRDATGHQRVRCNNEDVTAAIREYPISQAASKASGVPVVRKKLVALQRKMGGLGGVVIEGRDIGTNVFPDAEVKVFLTASAEERAKRRQEQLAATGKTVSYDTILAGQHERDKRDMERPLNPLTQAKDATVVDSSAMTADQVVARIVSLAREV